MFGITEYLLAGAASVALAAGGYGYVQHQQASLTKAQLESTRGELLTCGARLQNVIEDVESDNEIDTWTDLTTVPPGWLLPTPSTPGRNN